jgi:hypothetical protein
MKWHRSPSAAVPHPPLKAPAPMRALQHPHRLTAMKFVLIFS